MKKKFLAFLMGMTLICGLLTGCGTKDDTSGQQNTAEEQDIAEGQNTTEEQNPEADQEVSDPQDTAEEQDTADDRTESAQTVRVGAMMGPTSIGMVRLMELQEQGETENEYHFTLESTADLLLPSVISGDLDIVLVPANVASVLYNKTEGGISVIDINTLGVLYMESADTTIEEMEDLRGRTIYLTGKGTTPDFVLQYLLIENGIDLSEVTLEYKSESTEVAAVLAENPEAVGLLPQPYVTSLQMQNPDIVSVLNMTAEWEAIQGKNGSMLVTGVTIVRNEFLQEHPEAVQIFLQEHEASTQYVNENVEAAAQLVENYGIVAKAAVAQQAIPYCNITFISGEEMKTALSGYLEVLEAQDASFIGGSLPEDDFYYIP